MSRNENILRVRQSKELLLPVRHGFKKQISMHLDADWSLDKSPEATQYPRLKSASAITG